MKPSAAHVRLSEWKTLDPDSDEGSVLGNRELPRDARVLAQRLRDAGAIYIDELRRGLRISATSWVGRIQLGDLLVTIEPKVAPKHLLPLLRYAYALNDLRLLENSTFQTGGELLQDLLVAQLLAETECLLKRGLARHYVECSEDLALPKGRVDFQVLAGRQPLVAAVLPCRHHERSSDHRLNQVLFAGVRLAIDLAQNPVLRSDVRQVALRLSEEVTAQPLTTQLLQQAMLQLNRMTAPYRPALELIHLLHACSSMSLEDDVSVRLPGFLFDMNRFFQALVGRLFRDHLPPGTVTEEYALTQMMLYVPGANPRGRRSPRPRPDFLVRVGPKHLLFDAKYRDLWETELPREMLYQLAMYALSQPDASTATICYPSVRAVATEALVEIRDPVSQTGRAWVALRPLPLPSLAVALTNSAGKAECARLTNALIHGTHPRGSELADRGTVPRRDSNGPGADGGSSRRHVAAHPQFD